MIYENLKKLRLKNGYTMEEVAERINVSRQSVSKWEKGESLPDILKCQELAVLFGVSLDVLVNGNVYERTPSSTADGKYFFGIAKVGERGQIVIPMQARKVFSINPGDSLLIVGDVAQGLGIAKLDGLGSVDIPEAKKS